MSFFLFKIGGTTTIFCQKYMNNGEGCSPGIKHVWQRTERSQSKFWNRTQGWSDKSKCRGDSCGNEIVKSCDTQCERSVNGTIMTMCDDVWWVFAAINCSTITNTIHDHMTPEFSGLLLNKFWIDTHCLNWIQFLHFPPCNRSPTHLVPPGFPSIVHPGFPTINRKYTNEIIRRLRLAVCDWNIKTCTTGSMRLRY
jgi:hypothetical protein